MFTAQLIAVFWSSIVQVATYNWALGSIEDICTDDQSEFYTCPNAKTFYTASVVWGAIGTFPPNPNLLCGLFLTIPFPGPARIFGPGQVYGVLQWYWLLGALLPVCTYLAARKWPRSIARYDKFPIPCLSLLRTKR
jgi:hypothetical protein